MILIGERSLSRAMTAYVIHFHTAGPHQGLGDALVEGPPPPGEAGDRVVERKRLGGLLRSYQRAA